MMKDLGDKVSVRFYHVTETGAEDPPFKFDPVWVTVDKSTVKSASGDDLYAKRSLWVQMIEKAYAASRIDPDSLLISELPSASYDVYDNGGTGSFAMMVLLGASAVNPAVLSGYDRADAEVLPWGSSERNQWKDRNYAERCTRPSAEPRGKAHRKSRHIPPVSSTRTS